MQSSTDLKTKKETIFSGYGKLISYMCLLLLSFTVLCIMIISNIDLSKARYVLFMDELISFDAITQIYKSSNLHQIWTNISFGYDLRYGRAMYNLMALTSYIPSLYFGEQGIIIASRVTQTILIVSSSLLLTCLFIKDNLFRVITFIVALLVPYSVYYMSMPKPEPLILFSLVLFYYNYIKDDFKVGYSFIFLGLAFGLKISVLPIVLLCVFISIILSEYKKIEIYRSLFLYFFFGFCTAIPLFFPLFLLAFFPFFIMSKVEKYYNKIPLFAYFMANTIIFVFTIYYLVNSESFSMWLDWTFKGIGHGSDFASVNIFSWLSYINKAYFSDNLWLSISFVILLLVLLLTFIHPFIKKGFKCENRTQYLLIVSGVGLLLPILLFTQRLWGFYLYLGTLFLCVGVFSLYCVTNFKEHPIQKTICSLFCFVIACSTIYSWLPFAIHGNTHRVNVGVVENIIDLNTRTQTIHFKQQESNYYEIIDYLNEYDFNNQVTVYYSPWLFLPNDTANYQIQRFWGKFIDWESHSEIIVLHPMHADPILYDKYVIDSNKTCNESFCYVREKTFSDGVEILKLQKQLPTLKLNNEVLFNNSLSVQLKNKWSGQEEWGRWTEGEKATLIMKVSPKAVGIRLSTNMFVPPNSELDLTILVNDIQVSSQKYTQPASEIDIPFPQEVVDRLDIDNQVKIDFIMPNIASPQELGIGTDSRKLGIGLKGFTIYDKPSARLQKLNVQEQIFAHNFDTHFLYTGGWSGQEDWGRWTEGERASLILKVTSEIRGILLSTSMFVPPNGKLDLTVLVNGVQAFSHQYIQATSEINIPFPHKIIDSLSDDGIIEIEFLMSNLKSPKELGLSVDSRKLGIGLIKFITY